MINIIKIIYINLLGLFDFNKILIARNDGVKSNSEKKLIILGIILIIFLYLFNSFLSILSLDNPLDIFSIGFIVSTIVSFILCVLIVDSTIFRSNDIELLFSLPLTKNQVVYSKLFNVFIRNLVFNLLIMLMCFIKYYNIGTYSSNLLLIVFICTLFISVIPVVVVSALSYFINYINITKGKGVSFILKLLIMILIGSLSYLFSKDFNMNNLLSNISYIYPTLYLFNKSINGNYLLLIIYIIVNVLLLFLFSYVIRENYAKMCSILRGVDKKANFKMNKLVKKNKLLGYMRKDIRLLKGNKAYISNVIGFRMILSFCLILFFILIPYDKLSNIDEIETILKYLLPPILTGMVGVSSFTISSLSIEKDNIKIVSTLPIRIGEVLISKWLVGILIGVFFVIVNSTLSIIYFNTNLTLSIIMYLLPITFIIFIESLGLILDYRFITKNEMNDNVILNGRLISYIPILLSLIMLIYGLCTMGIGNYRYSFIGLSIVFIFLSFVILIYYLIYKKNLLKNIVD